ncbi:MAG: class I tRNA ligase family protein, partial [Myxococcota bacterium]
DLRRAPDDGPPADMYLEGSDQHRGWFQSSLLVSVATRGRAPYRSVLTHGFVVDEGGRKYSKSTPNFVPPEQIIKRQGAEILRLWVASEDYSKDISFSDDILKRLNEAYRKIRNTCRFILGNLADFDPAKDSVPCDRMGGLDRWILHRLAALTARVRRAYGEYEFHVVFHALNQFCTVDLSSFYLDILKDRLYCDSADGAARRAGQTAMYEVLKALTSLMAPVLAFTAEDIWDHLPGEKAASVHLTRLPEPEKAWVNDALADEYDRLLRIRGEAARAIEAARNDKRIGGSAEAGLDIMLPESERALVERHLADEDLSALFLVSEVALVNSAGADAYQSEEIPGLAITVRKAGGEKCARCWLWRPDVGAGAPGACARCAKVLAERGSAA